MVEARVDVESLCGSRVVVSRGQVVDRRFDSNGVEPATTSPRLRQLHPRLRERMLSLGPTSRSRVYVSDIAVLVLGTGIDGPL